MKQGISEHTDGALSGDRYAGLVTVIAVLVAAVYTETSYDLWDMLLACLGLTLCSKYRKDLASCSKRTFVMLLSVLFGLSVFVFAATLICYGIQYIGWVSQAGKDLVIAMPLLRQFHSEVEFAAFLLVVIFCFFVFRSKAKAKSCS